jgi:hypothetical protein
VVPWTVYHKEVREERLKDSEAKQLKSSEIIETEILTATTIPIAARIEAGIGTEDGTVSANPTRLYRHFSILYELISPSWKPTGRRKILHLKSQQVKISQRA